MKNTNPTHIQAKMFDFALNELVRSQRNSFEPLWTIDSWVKFLIWLSLNCGLPGDKESLENFANSLGSPLTIRMRKIFFERVLENYSLHVIADPAESQIIVLPLDKALSVSFEDSKLALDSIGLSERAIQDFDKWELHEQLIAIPWNS